MSSNARAAIIVIIIVASSPLARGAVPAEVKINDAAAVALMAGHKICGDDLHADACLVPMPCEDVDESLQCTEEDPVWAADGSTSGAGSQTRALFRAIVPLLDASHPNPNSFTTSRHRIVGTSIFWMSSFASSVASTRVSCERRNSILELYRIRHSGRPTQKKKNQKQREIERDGRT